MVFKAPLFRKVRAPVADRLCVTGAMCLVVTDGSAVLGLGDIGPEAGMPVMEGKCVLFKAFGNVDAFPLCIKSKDVDEIVNTIYLISGSFGGVNLEDIAAPRCFEIERKLKEKCDIPIFHGKRLRRNNRRSGLDRLRGVLCRLLRQKLVRCDLLVGFLAEKALEQTGLPLRLEPLFAVQRDVYDRARLAPAAGRFGGNGRRGARSFLRLRLVPDTVAVSFRQSAK